MPFSKQLTLFVFVFGAFLVIFQDTTKQKRLSSFTLKKDYTHFSQAMENNDTLYLTVDLSLCVWLEYHQIEITKRNDSVFFRVKTVVDSDSIKTFPKRYYNPLDTRYLEKIMENLDTMVTITENPFFTIFHCQKQDTLFLRHKNFKNGLENRKRYFQFLKNYYPEEMMQDFAVPPILEEEDN